MDGHIYSRLLKPRAPFKVTLAASVHSSLISTSPRLHQTSKGMGKGRPTEWGGRELELFGCHPELRVLILAVLRVSVFSGSEAGHLYRGHTDGSL